MRLRKADLAEAARTTAITRWPEATGTATRRFVSVVADAIRPLVEASSADSRWGGPEPVTRCPLASYTPSSSGAWVAGSSTGSPLT